MLTTNLQVKIICKLYEAELARAQQEMLRAQETKKAKVEAERADREARQQAAESHAHAARAAAAQAEAEAAMQRAAEAEERAETVQQQRMRADFKASEASKAHDPVFKTAEATQVRQLDSVMFLSHNLLLRNILLGTHVDVCDMLSKNMHIVMNNSGVNDVTGVG